MPFLGHREPDISDLGLSPHGTPSVVRDAGPADRVAGLVGRLAKDPDDEQLLLEALGLVPAAAERLAG